SKVLAAAGDDGTVRLWDVESGKEIRRLQGVIGAVFSITISKDGKKLAVGCEDGSVTLWDPGTGKQIFALQPVVHTKEPDTSYGNSVAFSPDGRLVISGATGVAWDTATGKEVYTLQDHRRWFRSSITFSPDGKTLA